VLRPDVVTLSAVFPPARSVVAPNFVQFENASRPALQTFPPQPRNDEPAQPARVAVTTTTAPTALTQQEQLAQLNQTLLRLGISPQSISLDNRFALLQSANDPPALLNLVHALGALSGQSVIGGSSATAPTLTTSSASNPSNPAQGATAQAQVLGPAQSQALAPSQTTLSLAGSGIGGTSETGASQQASANQSAALSGRGAAQFQELQITLQAVESSQATSSNGNSVPSSANQQAPSLSVEA
jgi:hypothetical protein